MLGVETIFPHDLQLAIRWVFFDPLHYCAHESPPAQLRQPLPVFALDGYANALRRLELHDDLVLHCNVKTHALSLHASTYGFSPTPDGQQSCVIGQLRIGE